MLASYLKLYRKTNWLMTPSCWSLLGPFMTTAPGAFGSCLLTMHQQYWIAQIREAYSGLNFLCCFGKNGFCFVAVELPWAKVMLVLSFSHGASKASTGQVTSTCPISVWKRCPQRKSLPSHSIILTLQWLRQRIKSRKALPTKFHLQTWSLHYFQIIECTLC